MATQAEGRVTAHRATVTEHQTELERAKVVADKLSVVDLAPVDAAYEASYAVYSANVILAHGTRVELVALAARQRADAVVQPALCVLGRTHATRGHRCLGQAFGDRAVALREGRG